MSNTNPTEITTMNSVLEKYYCPMHCEGDKTYNKPGDCPVCGMHLKKEESKSALKAMYTCPMHPQIRQAASGNCPICGMTLVPEKPDENNEEDKDYKKLALKFWIALALTIPVFLLGMSDLFPFIHIESFIPKKTMGFIELLLVSPVVFFCSWDFFKRGWSSVIRR